MKNILRGNWNTLFERFSHYRHHWQDLLETRLALLSPVSNPSPVAQRHAPSLESPHVSCGARELKGNVHEWMRSWRSLFFLHTGVRSRAGKCLKEDCLYFGLLGRVSQSPVGHLTGTMECTNHMRHSPGRPTRGTWHELTKSWDINLRQEVITTPCISTKPSTTEQSTEVEILLKSCDTTASFPWGCLMMVYPYYLLRASVIYLSLSMGPICFFGMLNGSEACSI